MWKLGWVEPLGAAAFAITKDPTWIGVGVAIGAAISWKKL